MNDNLEKEDIFFIFKTLKALQDAFKSLEDHLVQMCSDAEKKIESASRKLSKRQSALNSTESENSSEIFSETNQVDLEAIQGK